MYLDSFDNKSSSTHPSKPQQLLQHFYLRFSQHHPEMCKEICLEKHGQRVNKE